MQLFAFCNNHVAPAFGDIDHAGPADDRSGRCRDLAADLGRTGLA
jgi:hypothetical protein